MTPHPATHSMRDALIGAVHERMRTNPRLFFVTADFGAPALDGLRRDFPDRYLNVGIAEQNLVNVAAGLALEGHVVFAYAIAPFLVMRACEQIRNNLCLLGQWRALNVNLIGVGAGLSYDLSGPSHHSLEDLSIMRSLPNIDLFAPSDTGLVRAFADYCLLHDRPKYARLDGKPWPDLAPPPKPAALARGFRELHRGGRVCLLATGCMTHLAAQAAAGLARGGQAAGLIDVFMLRPCDRAALLRALEGYETVVTVEEAFAGCGGLDAFVREVAADAPRPIRVAALGLRGGYTTTAGDRACIQDLNRLTAADLEAAVRAAYAR